MSDPGFVAASYAIVLGGLALYVASVIRRIGAARRTTRMLERERERDVHDQAAPSLPADGGSAPRP